MISISLSQVGGRESSVPGGRLIVTPAAFWAILALVLIALSREAGAATITIDGGQTNQFIDGFGVNANSWHFNNDELRPVFDALIDQAGMTIFRVICNNGWE